MSQNRYEVLGKIADGGLGSVFKAYDRNLRREVALKRVRADSPEEAARQAGQLFEEARTLSTLQHPHIVTIFDVGQDDEGAYIVMELLKGETLEDIIERGALNEYDFRELVSQSLEGMAAAHDTGLIHLDIKPQNFMVIWLPSGKFQIKILDFGLSKISSQPLVQETDEEGAILGSIYFMTPEQFERSPVDGRTDLYSLGCVYYFALTQNYPFQGETAPEVMASHMHNSFIPLAQLRPDLPSFIHQWVEWLMSRDPDARPPSTEAAFEAFKTGKLPVSEAPPLLVLPEPDLLRPGSSTSQILRPTAPRPGRPNITQRLGQRPVPKPVARPVNIAAATAPAHLKPLKKRPKWLTTGVPVTLAVLLLGYFAVQFFITSRQNARFQALTKMETPVGSPKDVTLLLRALEDPAKSEEAGNVLGKIQGVDMADRQIVHHLQRTRSSHASLHLAQAIGQRRIGDAVGPLLEKLDVTTQLDVRQAVWTSLGQIATVPELGEVISKLPDHDIAELRTAENAIIRIARNDGDPNRRIRAILQAYRSSSGSDDRRAALLRALGKLGGPDSLPDLTAALKSSNPKLRTAAAVSLGEWPTAVPILALEDFIAVEKDAFIRTDAINSLGSLAPLSGDVPQDEIADSLITAYGAARDSREQLAILNALSKVSSPASLAFFEELPKTDSRRRPLATQAVKDINASFSKAVVISGRTVLDAAKAQLTPGPLTLQDGVIINWFGRNDLVSWLFKIEEPGELEIEITQASTSSKPGRYFVTLAHERLFRNVEKTSGAGDFKTFTLGRARFTKPGYYRVWVRPQDIPSGEILMRLKEVIITPTGA